MSSIALFFVLFLHLFLAIIAIDLETYIVHVQKPETQILSDLETLEGYYNTFLPAITANTNEEPRMVYSYHNVFTGFAARLSSDEVKALEKMEGFVSARHQKDSNYGRGTIIGVLDTGIAPDHPSFGDEGMPPPPAKWKGKCEFNFTGGCNNKLIGARYFSTGNGTPLDENGHGTHTASTAAGNFVKGTNVLGNANGTAVGIAPLAHVAMYKVCLILCSESDILAAMDVAIDDGVDIISISIGGFSSSFYDDNIALGAFSAMEKGIFVSCSAGNSGPFNRSLSNEAPWILTVGASTIDRKIRAPAVLGDNQEFDGESLFQPKDFPPTQLPLIYPGLFNASDFNASTCSSSSLNKTDIRGKIVLCMIGGESASIEKGQLIKFAGGAGMILMNTQPWANTTFADAHVLPAAHISYADGQMIINYINKTSNPTAAIIFKGTIIGDIHAPAVAGFSSRGPSFVSPGILKPDIIGPGVNILAAWPISVENNTNTQSTFNIISGTSMSCPHLSGIAAILKSTHPDWSPAVIKSAIMTTADLVNVENKPIEDERYLPANVFATGAGHVNPSKANEPGLVYDIQPEDYMPYLCGLNYTNRQVGTIIQRRVNCTETVAEAQLNYPSFAIRLGTSTSTEQTYTRTVTNVGDANEFYTVQIIPPSGVAVIVEPPILTFSELNQKLTYQVTFSRFPNSIDGTFQGFLTWSSAQHFVRSPIAATLI
ncbi:hypothetical protein ACH5RR_038537 [Cinchona calisaya]|uniref:Cucumisin n=1 Tax=Cinchona calisaya TaxID=153742 RepID=A0ABD2Y183_9GENT